LTPTKCKRRCLAAAKDMLIPWLSSFINHKSSIACCQFPTLGVYVLCSPYIVYLCDRDVVRTSKRVIIGEQSRIRKTPCNTYSVSWAFKAIPSFNKAIKVIVMSDL
jgi:hypothetical protein